MRNDQRWPEDGMRKWEVIFERALSAASGRNEALVRLTRTVSEDATGGVVLGFVRTSDLGLETAQWRLVGWKRPGG